MSGFVPRPSKFDGVIYSGGASTRVASVCRTLFRNRGVCRLRILRQKSADNYLRRGSERIGSVREEFTWVSTGRTRLAAARLLGTGGRLLFQLSSIG